MADDSQTLLSSLLESYQEVGGINHLNGVDLPSKQTVAEITRQLLRLVFPGFYQNDLINSASFESATREKLEWVCDHLGREIHRGFKFKSIKNSGTEPTEMARDRVFRFVRGLPDLRRILRTDVEAAYKGDPAADCFEEIILAYPGLEAIAVQRMAHALHIDGVALIPRMMTEWAHARTGIDIHPGAKIGSHFFIDHGTGVVIGETCKIGNRVKIYHGVTLGARSTHAVESLRGRKRHPTIEDDVTIYPGATILGGETVIGRGSVINGNVFLTKSIPPASRVAHEKHAIVVTPLASRE